jgi:hypothetical protein
VQSEEAAMKKVFIVIAIIAVIVIGVMLVRPLFAGDGNATFVSYAPGGKAMAYVTLDDISGMQPAHADQVGFIQGDRVKVKMGKDGLYNITGGPY